MKKEKAYTENGNPRFLACYDNGGKTLDRYTVEFTRLYPGQNEYDQHHVYYITMSANPGHAQGVFQHGLLPCEEYNRTKNGAEIAFTDLPEEGRRAVLEEYSQYWGNA